MGHVEIRIFFKVYAKIATMLGDFREFAEEMGHFQPILCVDEEMDFMLIKISSDCNHDIAIKIWHEVMHFITSGKYNSFLDMDMSYSDEYYNMDYIRQDLTK